MVATAAGLDSRLLEAARALLLAGRGTPDGKGMTLPNFLAARCRQLLGGYPTSIAEDEALLRELQQEGAAAAAAAEGSGAELRRQRRRTALRYRLGKKRVLQATLESVQQQQQQ